MNMLSMIRTAFVLVSLLTLLLGVAYPLLVTGITQVLLPHRAGGSLIEREGKVIGSSLLGQHFEDPKYFWGRLSATLPPYNAAASGGSNLSPGNPKLLEAVEARVGALQKADPKNPARIPVDLVTASASGLDPHISVAAAQYQIARVARARRMTRVEVADLIEAFAETPLLGEPYVHVLHLNLALDQASGSRLQDSGKNK